MEHWVCTVLDPLRAARAFPAPTHDQALDRIVETIEGLGYYLFQSRRLEALADELSESATLEYSRG